MDGLEQKKIAASSREESGHMKLQIKKFDPQQMKPHRIILLVGRRGSGKSVLMRDLMEQISKRVDFGIAMTPTEDTMSVFREHIPESSIYGGFDSCKMERMLNMQRALCKEQKQRALYVIMDDCMYDKRVLRSTAMRDLFMNGRHMHITFFNAMQYVMDMGPDLRTQVDYVFAFKENILTNKNKMWKYFFGMFDRFDDFQRVYDRCTDNYGVMVLDNTAPTTRMEDCVYWYRARTDLPKFRMGKKIFWDLSVHLARTDRDAESPIDRVMQETLAPRERNRITVVEKQNERGESTADEELTLIT